MNSFESNRAVHGAEHSVLEGLQVSLAPAPLLKRVLAYAVDLSIISSSMYLLLIFFGIAMVMIGVSAFPESALGEGGIVSGILTILLFLGFLLAIVTVLHGYFIYFEFKTGTTPGKRLFGLRTVSTDGSRLSLGQCIIRDMLRYVDCMLIIPGILSISLSKRNQRLGDLMAGTQVIHSAEREKESSFLYIRASTYRHLQAELRPKELSDDFRADYLRYAYQRFILSQKREDLIFEEKRWLKRLPELLSANCPTVDSTTLLLFFAETCHQQSLQSK